MLKIETRSFTSIGCKPGFGCVFITKHNGKQLIGTSKYHPVFCNTYAITSELSLDFTLEELVEKIEFAGREIVANNLIPMDEITNNKGLEMFFTHFPDSPYSKLFLSLIQYEKKEDDILLKNGFIKNRDSEFVNIQQMLLRIKK